MPRSKVRNIDGYFIAKTPEGWSICEMECNNKQQRNRVILETHPTEQEAERVFRKTYADPNPVTRGSGNPHLCSVRDFA